MKKCARHLGKKREELEITGLATVLYCHSADASHSDKKGFSPPL